MAVNPVNWQKCDDKTSMIHLLFFTLGPNRSCNALFLIRNTGKCKEDFFWKLKKAKTSKDLCFYFCCYSFFHAISGFSSFNSSSHQGQQLLDNSLRDGLLSEATNTA